MDNKTDNHAKKTSSTSKENPKIKPSTKDVQDLAAKIDETDEMKLKMLESMEVEKKESEELLYPSELNAHLIEQLKVMTCENNELRKLLFTKDSEMKEQKKTISDLNQRIRDIISGSGPAISSKSAGVISAKITDLCKQNRHLVAEVEGYKTKNASLERKIMQLQVLSQENSKLDVCICSKEPTEADPDHLKELQKQLYNVNKKLYESKNRNVELKNDILLATKILQQEMGDKFTSLKELVNDVAGWKGRAAQIVKLKAKITELEDKLSEKQKQDYHGKSSTKPQAEIIKELELKKKKEIDQAMKELDVLRDENKELKKKLDGAKCRIKNLECDSVTLRQKMQTFVDKSNHDDMLVNEQRTQIRTLEMYYQEMLKENTTKMAKMNSEMAEHQKILSNTDAKIDAMRKQSTEKAAKIDELRAQLLRYEECSLQSVFFTPMKTATDNEIKQLSSLVVTLNERLDAERHKWEELENTNRKLKEKKRRMERKIATLEDEIKKLRELPKRITRVSKNCLVKDMDMAGGGSTINKRHSSVTAAAVVASESSSESQPTEYEPMDKEDMRFKLELAEEKLKIMEDKLKMIEEEKQYDYNHLTDMIQTSKQLFNEALAVLQREKCLCF